MLDCSLIMLKNIKVIKLIGQFISGNGEFMFWLKNYESCKTVAHNIWDTLCNVLKCYPNNAFRAFT